MKVSLMQQIQRIGMSVAIAAFAYQPAMQASMAAGVSAEVSGEMLGQPSPTVPTNIVAANFAANKQLAQGSSFTGVGAHSTEGQVRIVEENGQRYLELGASFRTDSGPDLFVLLHRDAPPASYQPEDYVNLGRVQSFSGAQRYAIGADVDLTAFQSAVIWCQDFDVTFGYALL